MAKQVYDREYFRQQGRKGGLIGGKLSAGKLSPDERKDRARNAAIARWRKRNLPFDPTDSSPPESR